MASLPKRVQKDLASMMAADIQELGIYYDIDDVDARRGLGLIVGPEGTPYAHCPLLFQVTIPMDYPFASPQVTILTSDGRTRFHPNLYIEGKVCLSILGTYSGPKWVSTMSLETVFKSIHSLLNDNPIVNEPGWERYTLEEPRAANYAAWVSHNLLAHTLSTIRAFLAAPAGAVSHAWAPFEGVLRERLPELLKKLAARAAAEAAKGERTYVGIPYGMQGTTQWGALAKVAAELSEGQS